MGRRGFTLIRATGGRCYKPAPGRGRAPVTGPDQGVTVTVGATYVT
jgi:hypothetical protein